MRLFSEAVREAGAPGAAFSEPAEGCVGKRWKKPRPHPLIFSIGRRDVAFPGNFTPFLCSYFNSLFSFLPDGSSISLLGTLVTGSQSAHVGALQALVMHLQTSLCSQGGHTSEGRERTLATADLQ